MARAVRHKYTRTVNGIKESIACSNWYVKFFDPRVGRTVKKPTPYTDRRLAERHGHRLQLEAEQLHAGVPVDFAPSPDASIDSLIDLFKGHLESREVGKQHLVEVINRLRRMCQGRIFFLGEWTAAAIEKYISARRKAGMSAQTRNHHVQNAKQFTKWLIKAKYLRENPLADLGMINVAADRRRVRRALSPEEFAKLFKTTWKSKVVRAGLTGKARAILYLTAVCTGLRRLELMKLTVGAVSLKTANVTVEAAFSKNRRKDVVPLASAANEMKEFIKRRPSGEMLFAPLNRPTEGVKVVHWARTAALNLALDLEAAKVSVGDERGRVADFHSLRVTCITELIRQGVPLVTVQKYARHSNPKLTANIYTDTTPDDLARAAKLVRFGRRS